VTVYGRDGFGAPWPAARTWADFGSQPPPQGNVPVLHALITEWHH
jgi:hypothetical protein